MADPFVHRGPKRRKDPTRDYKTVSQRYIFGKFRAATAVRG